jgi:hypothetical protein
MKSANDSATVMDQSCILEHPSDPDVDETMGKSQAVDRRHDEEPAATSARVNMARWLHSVEHGSSDPFQLLPRNSDDQFDAD